MASLKHYLVSSLIMALSLSSMLHVSLAARHLLQTSAPLPAIPSLPPIPKVTMPPLPAMPTLPKVTLPPLPTLPTAATLPKPALPPLPSAQIPSLLNPTVLPTMPTIPKVTLPPLPTRIPTIPFFSPPPATSSP